MYGCEVLENGDRRITMTSKDYDLLLMALGVSVGSAMKGSQTVQPPEVLIELVNRLFTGSPTFQPYTLTQDKK